MKIRNFITGILCLLVMSNTFGQGEVNPKDTIIFEVGDRLILRIIVRDYALLKRGSDVPQVIGDFQKDLEQVSPNLPEPGSFKINYKPNEFLEFEGLQPLNKYIVSNNQVTPIALQNICNITAEGFSVNIEFNELQDLLNPGLPEAVKNIINQLPEKRRFLTTLQYDADDFESPPGLKAERQHLSYIDMLALRGGVGANIVYNRYLTDLTGEIGLHLSRKGIIKNQFYVSNNLLFDFDPERQIVLNNFTNIGYRRNLSNQIDQYDWLGVEFGLLTSRRGDFFPRNTYRIGINWEPGKHISVMPSLYFSGFFNQVSPGIRIGFGI